MIKLFIKWVPIRLLNSKTNDLDWYYSRPNQELKFPIRDLLFTPFCEKTLVCDSMRRELAIGFAQCKRGLNLRLNVMNPKYTITLIQQH